MKVKSSVRLRTTTRIGAAAIILVLASGCADDEGFAPKLQPVLGATATEVMLPLVEEASEQTNVLAASVVDVCATPASLVDARADLLADVGSAWSAWQATDSFDIGPSMERRSAAKLGYEVDTEAVDAALSTGPPSDPAEVNDSVASGKRGFPAMSYLLANATAENATDFPARCTYLLALSAAAKEETAAIAAEWEGQGSTPGFAETVVEDEPDEVLSEIVNMAYSDLEDSDKRLGAVAESGSAAPIELPPGEMLRVSGRIKGIAALFGIDSPGGAPGLSPLLSDDTKDELGDEIDALSKAFEPYATAPQVDTPDHTTVKAIADQLEDLHNEIGTTVMSELNVSVGFSDNDGDS